MVTPVLPIRFGPFEGPREGGPRKALIYRSDDPEPIGWVHADLVNKDASGVAPRWIVYGYTARYHVPGAGPVYSWIKGAGRGRLAELRKKIATVLDVAVGRG